MLMHRIEVSVCLWEGGGGGGWLFGHASCVEGIQRNLHTWAGDRMQMCALTAAARVSTRAQCCTNKRTTGGGGAESLECRRVGRGETRRKAVHRTVAVGRKVPGTQTTPHTRTPTHQKHQHICKTNVMTECLE